MSNKVEWHKEKVANTVRNPAECSNSFSYLWSLESDGLVLVGRLVLPLFGKGNLWMQINKPFGTEKHLMMSGGKELSWNFHNKIVEQQSDGTG